jgi:CDP-glucose 4,6-dehydratase
MSDFTWAGKRVFATGLTGFVGTHLAKKLKSLGAELLLLEHVRPAIDGVEVHKGDITNLDATFESQLMGFKPEIVFHLAAQPLVSVASESVCDTIETNVHGTANLLCVCKDIGSINSFVHVSTDKVYGNISPITKDTVPQGVEHPYNASKLSADVLAQMYANFFDVKTVIIRNANVYGSGDLHFDRVIPNTIRRAFLGKPPIIRGNGGNTRDYIHVSDVVEGYLKAAELPYASKLTLLNLCGFNHTVLDVVDTILAKMSRVDLAPTFEKQWRGEIPDQHIENDSARELIGWSPSRDISDGLDEAIPWYRAYLEKNG